MRKDELLVMNQQYEELFAIYGDSEKSVGWNKPKQMLRFQIFFNMIDRSLSGTNSQKLSVLDLGCGLGHFYKEMIRRGHKWNYTGVDVNKRFILECKKNFPEANFIESLVTDDEIITSDVIIASGLFNRKIADIELFIEKIFLKAMANSNKLFCFNFLHTGAIKKYEKNHYVSVSAIEKLIDRKQIKGWEIDGLTVPGEFTIGCYK